MPDARVLVTGYGGFLAAALVRHVRVAWPDARVLGVGRRAGGASGAHESVTLDLADAAALDAALARFRPDIVFHLAGRIAGDWIQLHRDNLLATHELLEAVCRHAPGARVVVAGSAAEYGMTQAAQLPVREDHPVRPVSAYGVSKAVQSLAAASYAGRGLHVVVARIFNIVGRGTPATTALGAFAAQLREIAAGRAEARLRVGNLSARRDFVDVADIASAFCALAQRGRAGDVYNVCSGQSAEIGDLLARLIALSELEVSVETDAARLRGADVPEVRGSFAKIEAACGWEPRVALSDSLRSTLAA